ncbi:DUF3489 domain-containing protein [Variibacter gotjawalensis]|uniref:DUF3489 domain-containing protein n=1 Tax=Variibacter gotjawalensis TaxID=1333996 RepID=UPI000BBB481E|nr:DUF3489 domain-containing protein [Variibacter gotjawalensis]NIK49752.1 hypothetical protein [Variibacter gotjawalensis]
MKYRSKKVTTTKRTVVNKPVRKKTKAFSAVRAGSGHSTSKQDAILSALKKAHGATAASLIELTGWQPHSVRGFLAGTVRKKLGLKVISEKVDGARRYQSVRFAWPLWAFALVDSRRRIRSASHVSARSCGSRIAAHRAQALLRSIHPSRRARCKRAVSQVARPHRASGSM